ncbi:hypothetical protein BC827DRAFT_536600 [Russula dissimulans]|nr:hypothetical protein BC827DRAFT_536600 [Russula dissimulans]
MIPSLGNSTVGGVNDVVLLTGPILIGNLVNWLLLGVLTMQIYAYYLCFPKDYRRIKSTVYGLYLLDIIQTVFTTEGAWRALCVGWGDPSSLIHTSWGFSMIPVVSGVISSWVQIFFAWRIWVLGQNIFWKGITLVTIAIALAQGAAAISTGIKFASGINNTQKISAVNSLVTLWLSGSVAADILIAGSMIYFLVSAKGQSVWRRTTNKRITKLIRSTVETGTVSAAAASIELGLYLGFNQNNLHTVIYTAMRSWRRSTREQVCMSALCRQARAARVRGHIRRQDTSMRPSSRLWIFL